MCQPWRWFWGLIPLALIALLALYFKPDPIQNDLSNRVGQDLVVAGEAWASVSTDGRDVTLSGTAPSEAAQITAREVAEQTWGVRIVDDTTSLLALANPFVWQARLESGKVTLSGNVPSTEARVALLEDARKALPAAEIDGSDLIAARGVPDLEHWNGAVRFGLTQLSGLASGQVSLSNLAYSVVGAARNSQSYEDVVVALRNLPDGVTLAAESVSAPVVSPHRWDGAYDGKTLTLSGVAPDFAARDALLAAAKAALPRAEIDNQVGIAGGGIDSAAWGRGTGFALQQFGRLSKGTASLEDGRLSIAGEAASVEDYESVQAALSLVPAGIELARADIVPAAADTFAWSAGINDAGVTLDGFVPDESVRASIEAAAGEAFPEVAVRNRMRVAQGPGEATADAWRAGSSFVLTQLAQMSEGRALMTPGNLTFDGVAKSSQAFDLINDALSVLPEGFDLGRNGVLAPIVEPFVWSATLDANAVTIDGFAPSAKTRNELVGTFTEARPGTEVQSTTMVGRGPLNEQVYEDATAFAARLFGYFSEGTALIEGDVLSVSGIARDVDAFKAAQAAADALPDGLNAGTIDIRPAAIGVLSWTATRDASQMVLDGFVPSEAVRKSVVSAAQDAIGDGTVTDRMEVATGGAEAAVWGNATAFALVQLGRMTRGQARLSGTEFSLQGIAPDFPAYEAILADVPGAMPGGMKLVRADILPPALSPYVWSARRGVDTLTLSGYVPSEAVRREVAAFAGERFSGTNIVDEMKLASGAPDGMVQAVGVAFAALGNLSEGSVSLDDKRITLTGEAPSEDARSAADDLIAERLPTGFSGTSSIRIAAPPAPSPAPQAPADASSCQDQLNDVMAGNLIRFEVNKANIRAESFEVLDRLAEVAKACPAYSIEVGGHTDSDGPDDYNQTLSQQRAQAVVRYLVAAGVRDDRLSAVGYGESKPIASNDNDAGKARNRRIEFTIIQ